MRAQLFAWLQLLAQGRASGMQSMREDALQLPLVSHIATPSYYVPLTLNIPGSATSGSWIIMPSEGHGQDLKP